MTLQSLKNRPTTPPSTRGWSRRNRTRLLAGVIALGGVGLGVAAAAEPGETMLEALKQRDAGAHWDATAEMLPSKGQFRTASGPDILRAPTVSAQTPASVADESTAGQWRASTRTAKRAAIPEAAVAQQDLPPIPDMYDPPPAAPSAESSGDGASDRAADDEAGMDPGVRPIAGTPDALRDIEAILPYYDYDPNPDSDDPCLHLCPRPDGKPCKEYEEGEYAPRCPEEVPLGTGPFVARSLPPSIFAWKASNITYNPLYFQDVALERYGHAYHPLIQPAVSVGRFSAQLVTLPYHMTLDPPHKEMYPLGYYRPGECAPKLLYQPPLNAKAAAVTAGFYTGFGLILP